MITFVFFTLEWKYKPSKIPSENTRNIVSNGIYAFTNLLFLILHLSEGKITQQQKENFIGWPLIISVVFLILTNYVISMRSAIKAMKERCNKKGKKANDKKHAKKTSKVTPSSMATTAGVTTGDDMVDLRAKGDKSYISNKVYDIKLSKVNRLKKTNSSKGANLDDSTIRGLNQSMDKSRGVSLKGNSNKLSRKRGKA